MEFQIVARGRNSTSDNHCAINRSIGVQWHGVNQFLASRNIPRHIQANWFALFVKAIFVIALRVGSMWLAASSGCWAADHSMCLIMRRTPNSALVDRVDFATPAIAVLSTDDRPLGSCSRAAGWSAATLCHGPEGEVLTCVSNVCSRGNCGRDVLA